MAVKDVIQNDSINQNWNKMKYIARFVSSFIPIWKKIRIAISMIFRIQTADIKRIHDGFYDQRD